MLEELGNELKLPEFFTRSKGLKLKSHQIQKPGQLEEKRINLLAAKQA